MDSDNIIKELIAIKKLLILQLLAKGFSRTAIASALGITTAADVRKLIPNIKLPSDKSNKSHS